MLGDRCSWLQIEAYLRYEHMRTCTFTFLCPSLPRSIYYNTNPKVIGRLCLPKEPNSQSAQVTFCYILLPFQEYQKV